MPERPKVPARFGELAAELLQLTQNGKIHWSGTDDPNTFLLLRDAGHVFVSSRAGGSPYRLALHAPSGEEAQSYSGHLSGGDINESRLVSIIQQLWLSAQQSAQGSDALVSKFLQDLRNY